MSHSTRLRINSFIDPLSGASFFSGSARRPFGVAALSDAYNNFLGATSSLRALPGLSPLLGGGVPLLPGFGGGGLFGGISQFGNINNFFGGGGLFGGISQFGNINNFFGGLFSNFSNFTSPFFNQGGSLFNNCCSWFNRCCNGFNGFGNWFNRFNPFGLLNSTNNINNNVSVVGNGNIVNLNNGIRAW